MENIALYHQTGLAMGLAAALLLLQVLVADVAGVLAKHTPGEMPAVDHSKFHFRSTRAFSNMNETIAVFILFALIGILSGANAVWLSRFAWVYLLARSAYAICYWMNWKLARSVMFGFSVLGLIGLGIVMAGGLMH